MKSALTPYKPLTRRNMSKIAIDIGHGLSNRRIGVFDPGAVDLTDPNEGDYISTREYDLNLAYATAYKVAVESLGVNTVTLSGLLVKRDDTANKAGVLAGVSWHANASKNKKARGLSIYVSPGAVGGVELAENIAVEIKPVCERFKMPFTGIKKKSLYLLNKTEAAFVLMETGFISNPEDERTLHDSFYREAITEATAAATLKFLNVYSKEPLKAASDEPQYLYWPNYLYNRKDKRGRYVCRGMAVLKLQQLLGSLGFDPGRLDGIFGSNTETAVRAFQEQNGLDVDGIVGPKTRAKLEELLHGNRNY